MASGTELAVGYVSLVAETSQLSRGINSALATSGRNAEQHGQRMGRDLGTGMGAGLGRNFRASQALAPGVAAAGATGRQMGQSMGQQTVAQLKQFMSASGVLAGGLVGVTAAVGLAMAGAVKTGNDMTTNLNKLQGASRATAQEMAQVSARAKELGNDTQLTGTSATDAASAMTELVKGGFNVSQAMSAARGTLQLADAAQISAADAATIQADALHAFGLQATDAARVPDVLAYVATASTGEMADFAYGFQAGGAVMNQFGISVEDAAATLGVLANAGIKSSDAGTLVKSMLLALASPSDQASQALDELGVRAFDASGNFVGMRAIMEQMQVAAQRMTPEMYAMSASTAFGSDAARLAGIAAQQGGEGFDTMRVAVERQGAAAELAAANTQGLPGVFERLSNTSDRAKLSLYGLIQGPLQQAGDAINNGLNSALDVLEGKTSGGGPIDALMETARDAGPAFLDIGKGLVSAASALGGAAWSGFTTVLQAATNTLQILMPLLSGAGSLISDNSGVVTTLAAAWLGMKFVTPLLTNINTGLRTMGTTALTSYRGITQASGAIVGATRQTSVQMGAFGTNIARIGESVPLVARMQQSFVNGAIGAERFGRGAGLAAAGVTGLKGAASGAVGLLGGPFSAALLAAVTAFTLISSATAENKQRTKDLADEQGRLIASTRDMYDQLARTEGNVDDSVIATATKQVDVLNDKFDTLRSGASIGDWLKGVGSDVFGLGDFDLGDAAAKQGTAEYIERIKGAMNDLGITSQQVGVVLSGSQAAWDEFAKNTTAAGQGGRELVDELRPLREEFLESKAAAENLTPGVMKLRDAMNVLGDSTASTEDKTNALKTALDTLAGKQPDVAEATKKYNDTMREVADTTAEVVDKTKGFGDGLVGAGGAVNTATANGSKLYDQLQSIKDATVGVAASGGDLQAAFANNTIQFQQLASSLGLSEEQVRRMAEAMGLVPERIQTLIQVNSDDVVKDLALVKSELSALPPDTPVKVNALTDDAQAQLEAVGFKVERLPDNKGVVITAPTGDAQASIQGLIDKMMNVPSELTITSALKQLGGFNPTEFNNAGDAQRARLGIGPDRTAPGYVQYDPNAPVAMRPVQRPPGGEEGGTGAAIGDGNAGQVYGGTTGQDSVPALLMPDEHVWTTAEVHGAGGHNQVAALRAMAAAGQLRHFEQGGPVNPAVPPQPVDPRIVAIDQAYRQSGRPYDYGPWDCSMYMSSIYGAMSGAGQGRNFNTESDFAALGFKKGYKPGALNIGIHHGGGGKSSHMAGTLPNGVNVENSSNGSVYGPGAAGAMDGQFEDHWYYEGPGNPGAMVANPTGQPAVPGQPGSPNGNSQGAGDPALMGGQGDASMALAGAAPSGDPTRTEGYIPAAAGNTAPSGSGVIGGLTGLAVQGVNGAIDMAASAASSGANMFAPGSGAAIQMGAAVAKRGVQYAGEMAGIWGDALVEQLTPFGAPRWLATSPGAFMPQTPNQQATTTTMEEGAQAAAQVAAQAPPMPEGNAHMPAGAVEGVAPPPGPAAPPAVPAPGLTPPAPAPGGAAPGTPASGAGMGAPPGPAPAMDPNLLKLGGGFGIFDQGGVLAPGMVGANMGTTPEMVLTQEQWGSVAAGAASAPLEPAQDALDFSTHIGTVTVTDVNQMKQELDSRGRLAMMRYAGRSR